MIVSEVKRVEAGAAFSALKALKDEGFNMLVDLTAVDWSALNAPKAVATAVGEEFGTPKICVKPSAEEEAFLAPRPARFEVIYRLMRLDLETGQDKGRAEVRCCVAEGETSLRSAASLWPIADWLERELWDMFGVRCADRPDIKRLYLYESFQGHALRKDYPISRRQPQIGPPSGEPADNPSFNTVKPALRYD